MTVAEPVGLVQVDGAEFIVAEIPLLEFTVTVLVVVHPFPSVTSTV